MVQSADIKCVPTIFLIAIGWVLFECSNNNNKTLNSSTDTDEEGTTPIDEDNELQTATLCNSSNILGTWENVVSGDDTRVPSTYRQLFREDGTFVETILSDSTVEDERTGDYKVTDGRIVIQQWFQTNDSESFTGSERGCYLIDNRLFLDPEFLFNPDAETGSVVGT